MILKKEFNRGVGVRDRKKRGNLAKEGLDFPLIN